jgi:soluble lytic murein transglycosylase-like protein
MPHRFVAAFALACLLASSAAAEVPESLVAAVIHVESGGRANLVGRAREIGLMQIKLETARGVGYHGSRAALFDPATNIRFGTAYLELAWRRAHGDLCVAASLFNMGVGARPRCTAYGLRVLAALRHLSRPQPGVLRHVQARHSHRD